MATKKDLLFHNTYKEGHITILIYKDKKDKEFTGVALQFDLVVKAKTKKGAEECIIDVTTNYLKNVQENKLSEELLNRPADVEYWKVYKLAIQESQKLSELSELANIANKKKTTFNKTSLPFSLSSQGYQNGNFNYLQ